MSKYWSFVLHMLFVTLATLVMVGLNVYTTCNFVDHTGHSDRCPE